MNNSSQQEHHSSFNASCITWLSNLRLLRYKNYGTRLTKNENQNKPWCYWNVSIRLLEKSNAGACGHISESNFRTNRLENDSNMSSQNFEVAPSKFIPELNLEIASYSIPIFCPIVPNFTTLSSILEHWALQHLLLGLLTWNYHSDLD